MRPRLLCFLFGSAESLRLARGTAVSSQSVLRPHVRPVAAPFAAAGEGGGEEEEGDEDEDEKVDPDAEGVAKMRVAEIKAELDVRGIGYAGIFEKVRRYGSIRVKMAEVQVNTVRGMSHRLPKRGCFPESYRLRAWASMTRACK